MLQFLDDKLQVEGNYAHSLHASSAVCGFMVELTIYLVSGLVTYVIISGTRQILPKPPKHEAKYKVLICFFIYYF